jgi:hypothetical protein
MEPEIQDTYFTRFFIPVIVSILIFFLVFAIVSTPSGTNIKWDTFTTAFQNAKVGGRR